MTEELCEECGRIGPHACDGGEPMRLRDWPLVLLFLVASVAIMVVEDIHRRVREATK